MQHAASPPPFLPLLTIPSHQEWPIMSRITGINQDLSSLLQKNSLHKYLETAKIFIHPSPLASGILA